MREGRRTAWKKGKDLPESKLADSFMDIFLNATTLCFEVP